MPVTHAFISLKADSSDTTKVRASDQNAAHLTPTFLAAMIAPGAALVWDAQPSAVTELVGTTSNRTIVVLTRVATVRLVVRVDGAGFAGSRLALQYSTDGIAWSYLTAATSGPYVAIDSIGTIAGSWFTIDAGAKADVHLRLVGTGGNASASPVLGAIQVQTQ